MRFERKAQSPGEYPGFFFVIRKRAVNELKKHSIAIKIIKTLKIFY